ncbi:MOSC domain-containing protein [Cohnella panacarvi]|uniref:MOSC domain-containing protein n=1 Tax=Cohnella panacarvi TaxID=400776 RepID=UPI00047E84DF|nr:MOSC domain-containing protein [Cohnella panacarvi]
MHITVGTVNEINRYPVKSFAGERLESCIIEPYGISGDRVAAFYDEARTGWDRFVTARDIPRMLTYGSRFVDGEIQVTAADGRTFGWDDGLLAEIQQYTDAPISLSRVKEPHPEDSRLLSVDCESILIVTDATMRKVEAAWGRRLDNRRFRGNFVVTVEDGAMFEADWIGRKLAVGDVQLKAERACVRCVMITIDPETNKKDMSLLKQVTQDFNSEFGVYCSVVRTGQVRLGDKVRLIE